MVVDPAEQADRRLPPPPRQLLVPRVDPLEPGREQALRPIRPRHRHRLGRGRRQPGHDLVPAGGRHESTGRGSLATLSRAAAPVCPLPPPSVREVEHRRLLPTLRVLLADRPEEGGPTGRRPNLPQPRPGAGGRPQGHPPGSGPRWQAGRARRRRRSADGAGRLDDHPRQPVLRPLARQPLLEALLLARAGRAGGRHAAHESADESPPPRRPRR